MAEDAARLQAIRARAAAATPGPWCAEIWADVLTAREASGGFQWVPSTAGEWRARPVGMVWRDVSADYPEGRAHTGLPGRIETTAPNAEFIAHSREDIPYLLTRLEAAEQRATGLEADAAALREGLEWLLAAAGWRGTYYAPDCPPVIDRDTDFVNPTLRSGAGAALLARLRAAEARAAALPELASAACEVVTLHREQRPHDTARRKASFKRLVQAVDAWAAAALAEAEVDDAAQGG